MGLEPILAGKAVWRTIAGTLLGPSVESNRLDAWFGASAIPSRDPQPDIRLPPSGDVIASFERTANLRMGGTSKRDSGTYYTPLDLAEFVVAQTLEHLSATGSDPLEWRLIDPASGAGVFALTAIRQIVPYLTRAGLDIQAAREHAARQCVHLVDADPLAVALARCLILAEVGPTLATARALENHVRHGDSVIGGPVGARTIAPDAFAWSDAFPTVFTDGGFHAVLGNPPWGAIKPSIREYAATVDAGLLRLDSSSLRTQLAKLAPDQSTKAATTRQYAAALRTSGYRYQGPGDTEFYRFFVELAHSLVRPRGVIGLLIPSAFQRAVGAAPLRQLLLKEGSVELWMDFLNTRGFFAIHKMFRFALLLWREGEATGIARAHFGVTSTSRAREALQRPPLPLSSHLLARVSPDLRTIPDVRSAEDVNLYDRLHGIHPPLGADVPGAWRVRFRREFDMTNDAHRFIPRDEALAAGARPTDDGMWIHPVRGLLLPVYEGRMVHQFDAAAKAHVEGHGRSARWELLGPQEKHLRSRLLLPADEATSRGVRLTSRAAFCDVTGHANERTVLAATLPALAVGGNKVPTCEFEGETEGIHHLWTAIANSFVVDWIMRRRVSTTLNYFHWDEVPFPRISTQSEVGHRLVEAARALGSTPGHSWDSGIGERASLRARIDADVMRLYDLDLHDATVIFSDFPILDRGTAAGHQGVTRDLVLAELARATGASSLQLGELGIDPGHGPDSLEERVQWHEAAGAFAYIPGELALRRMSRGPAR